MVGMGVPEVPAGRASQLYDVRPAGLRPARDQWIVRLTDCVGSPGILPTVAKTRNR
jgi:hypothetical protein